MQVTQKGNVWQAQSLKCETTRTEHWIWTLSLAKQSITKVMRISLLPGSSNLQIRLRLRQKLKKTKRQDILNSVTTEWQSAVQIADHAEIQYKCAIRMLVRMALAGEIEIKFQEWVDERYRRRKLRMYRRTSISDSERAQLLNQCFGITVFKVPR